MDGGMSGWGREGTKRGEGRGGKGGVVMIRLPDTPSGSAHEC